MQGQKGIKNISWNWLCRPIQTSALDTYTEQALLQNINSILKEKQRTSVFVAHRLRTIYDADQILVLKDGRVAESGKHAQLLVENGIYAELWNGEFLLFHFSSRTVIKRCWTLITNIISKNAAQERSLAQDVDLERKIEMENLDEQLAENDQEKDNERRPR